MATTATQIRFLLSALATILSATVVGYFNVGILYLFGLPLILLVISLVILWTTKIDIRRKAVATLVALPFVPAGFYIFIWWHEITIIT